jgi:hypothetical protein
MWKEAALAARIGFSLCRHIDATLRSKGAESAVDRLGIQRRGVHGFRATAACELVDLKCASGYNETEARRELAVWLGHNPHRTEVTYAYVPKNRCA